MVNYYEKACISSRGDEGCLRHIKLCHNSWTSLHGECQVFRTNLEYWNINKEFSENGPRAQMHCCYSQSWRTLVCYLSRTGNVRSTKSLEDSFYSWNKLPRLMKTWVCFCLIKTTWPSFLTFLLLHYQRQAKYSENKLKSIKARNEYLLTLEATNASVFKYYIHDLSDLIDVSTQRFVYTSYHSLMRKKIPSFIGIMHFM